MVMMIDVALRQLLQTSYFVTMRFRHRKPHSYDSKLPYFCILSVGVLYAKPQGYAPQL